jgi:hypothetical protein
MSEFRPCFPWGIYIGNIEIYSKYVPLFIDTNKKGFYITFNEKSKSNAN